MQVQGLHRRVGLNFGFWVQAKSGTMPSAVQAEFASCVSSSSLQAFRDCTATFCHGKNSTTPSRPSPRPDPPRVRAGVGSSPRHVMSGMGERIFKKFLILLFLVWNAPPASLAGSQFPMNTFPTCGSAGFSARDRDDLRSRCFSAVQFLTTIRHPGHCRKTPDLSSIPTLHS